MVYVQKRIAVGLEVVQFFTMRHWDFRSDKLGVICEKLSPSEHKMYKKSLFFVFHRMALTIISSTGFL